MVSQILIAVIAVMATSLIGVLFTQKAAGAFLQKNLSRLVSFAGGVFLVTVVVLALEVFHLIHSPIEGVVLIALGYGLAWVMHYMLPESHHHHDEQCAKSAKKLIVGDAIHNIGDGIILVPAFMASTALGIAVTVSIVIHEALQEISEFFVLRRAGYSVKKALAINFAVSSTILIGVLIGVLALATTNLEGLLLALTSGFFLHVVLHDLLFVKSEGVESLKSHALLVAFGALLMLGVNTALGDFHIHGDHDHEHHHEEEHHDHEADVHHEEEHGHEHEEERSIELPL